MMLLRRRRWVIGGLLLAVLASIVLATWFAPDSTAILLNNQRAAPDADCLTATSGDCLVLPTITGVTLNGDEITFPAAFDAPYTLVVMPFTDDQQTRARGWLAPFRAMAADYEGIAYVNLAALPDLAPVVRSLVLGGMQMGVTDGAVRQQIAVAFLDDQRAFLDALAIPDTGQMQLFIIGANGTLYWRGTGAYAAETEADLRVRLDELTS